jgi:cobalt/nickel transport protein
MSAEAIKSERTNKGILKNLLLIAIVIALAVSPILILKDAEFGGADGEAEQAIIEINSNYEPWFSPIFEPKSGEIESLLFALQAAIGAGVIAYVLGYMRGRKKREEMSKL